ncbi:MAG: molecular chaperone TorD family protein [Candidatus Obscuribacterales bacterium]
MSAKLKRPKASTLCGFAPLLIYPDDTYKKHALDWQKAVGMYYVTAGDLLEKFNQEISKLTTSDLEEIFTRTFDMAPVCVPYISAHIFGDENYERGKLMSGLLDRYSEIGFDYGREMPDHVAVVLRFAGQCQDDELQELIEYVLSEPIKQMADSLSGSDNPYQWLLLSILEILRAKS